MKSFWRMQRCVLFLCIVLFLPCFAFAAGQEGSEAETALGAEVGPFTRTQGAVGLSGGYIAPADVKNGEGEVSVYTERALLRYGKFALSYTAAQYDWNDVDPLPFGNGEDDPWDNLHSLALSFRHDARSGENWGWFASATLTSDFEEEMDESFGGSVASGIVYRPTKMWSLVAGAALRVSPLGVAVVPALGAQYGGQNGPNASGTGITARIAFPSSEVKYTFSERFALRVGAAYEGGTYRLADDSPVEKKGYASLRGVSIGLYADWTPVENLSLSAGPEYRFARQYTFYDDDGDKDDSYDVDNALGGALRVNWAF